MDLKLSDEEREKLLLYAQAICLASGYDHLVDYAAEKVYWRQAAWKEGQFVAYGTDQTPEALTVLQALCYSGNVRGGVTGFYRRDYLAEDRFNDVLQVIDQRDVHNSRANFHRPGKLAPRPDRLSGGLSR